MNTLVWGSLRLAPIVMCFSNYPSPLEPPYVKTSSNATEMGNDIPSRLNKNIVNLILSFLLSQALVSSGSFQNHSCICH